MNGEVVLVTGAARGIGLEISRRFVELGATVVMLDRLPAVCGAATELSANGAASAIQLDLVNEEEVRVAVESVRSKHGEVSVLVNCAGISGRTRLQGTPVEETSLESWQEVIDVNLTSIFLLCRSVLPSMIKNGGGRIVNLSSIAGRGGSPSNAHYAASKTALLGFSRGLANEVAEHSITVNCVAPGFIQTPMTEVRGQEAALAYASQAAVGRVGTTADIAEAVLYLASEECSYVTGFTLDVNGGMFMS